MIWIGLRNYFIWMVIYLGIGTVLSLLLPFPYALGVMLIVIFLGNIIKTEIRLRKTGLGGIKSKVQSQYLCQDLDRGAISHDTIKVTIA